jgi:putative membrane protein
MYEITFFISALSIFFDIIYVLSTYYILHQEIPLWGALNIFDLLGMVIAVILTVNVVEVYVKYRVRPLGRIAADVLLSSFFILVADNLVGYMLGKVSVYYLLYVLITYTVVGLITLFILGLVRHRYGEAKGRGKPGPKGPGVSRTRGPG